MDNYTATEQAFKNGYARGYEQGKKDTLTSCVFCGEEVPEGRHVCPNCEFRMYQYPSVRKKVWCAIKSSIKSLFKR